MISENLKEIQSTIPDDVTLVAVSKTKPSSAVLEAYECGQRIFGENKVQELVDKAEELPKDIEWHMIGHLQSNKVKYIAPFVALIHSIDSLKLLTEINKQGKINDRIIECLLQFHIGKEESKFGLNNSEAQQILESVEFKEMKHIAIVGVMGMATFTDNEDQVREEFRTLKNSFDHLKNAYFVADNKFTHISMGMSGDYHLAIEEGSTMVRVGSSIFGGR